MNPIFARGNQRTARHLIQLRRHAISDQAARVAQRIHAIVLSLQGHTTTHIAGLLKLHRSSVPLWIEQWNQHGEQGLLEGHRSGRPPLLTARQRQQIQDILDSGPVAYGLETGGWTAPVIGQVIEEQFDVCYHPGHVRKLLRQWGYSVQRPTTQLVQASTAQKNRWERSTDPGLQKKPVPKKRS
jgi:transposase